MELQRAKLLLTRIGKLYLANTLLRNWVIDKPERVRGDFLADVIGPTLNFALGIFQSIDDYDDNERHADEIDDAIRTWFKGYSDRLQDKLNTSLASPNFESQINLTEIIRVEYSTIHYGISVGFLIISSLRWFNAFLLHDRFKMVEHENNFLSVWYAIHEKECEELGLVPVKPTKRIQEEIEKADELIQPIEDYFDLYDSIQCWDIAFRLSDLIDKAEHTPERFTNEQLAELKKIEDYFYGLYPDPSIHWARIQQLINPN